MVPSGRKWEKVVDMFYGSYSHNLDNKGRLVIPSKMRDELGAKAYILKGFDNALFIYKEIDFQKLMEHLQSLDYNQKAVRAFVRAQLSSVCELEIDRQGRALVPAQLVSKYHIGKEVIVVGALDHIEVWNKAEYESYQNEAESSFEDNAEGLGKQDK